MQYIMMTHDGPFGSSTSKNEYFHENMTCYTAGSQHLTDLLLKNKETIVCNIHGHTHDGSFI